MIRNELVEYLDAYLGIAASRDYSNNGLQVEGKDEVTHLAVAVDTNLQTIRGAIDEGADFLLVHHGLFWGKPLLVTGPHRRRVQTLLQEGCSLYAAHLPLDRHPEVGNNAQLARMLDLNIVGELGEAMGATVGFVAEASAQVTPEQLAARLEQELGQRPLLLRGGPDVARRVGIISGGAAEDVGLAAAAGCDTFITGETSHAHYHDASEYGVNVIFGGHYATETVGVRALAEHLQQRFHVECTFIDRPTGL